MPCLFSFQPQTLRASLAPGRWEGRGWGGTLQDVALVTHRRSHPLCFLLPGDQSQVTPPLVLLGRLCRGWTPALELLGRRASQPATLVHLPPPGPLNAPTDVSASTSAVSFAGTGLRRVSAGGARLQGQGKALLTTKLHCGGEETRKKPRINARWRASWKAGHRPEDASGSVWGLSPLPAPPPPLMSPSPHPQQVSVHVSPSP